MPYTIKGKIILPCVSRGNVVAHNDDDDDGGRWVLLDDAGAQQLHLQSKNIERRNRIIESNHMCCSEDPASE